jgi:hypothetical protein
MSLVQQSSGAVGRSRVLQRRRRPGSVILDGRGWSNGGRNDDAAMGVLAYLGPLTTHVTVLQSACADHGIIVRLPAS